MINRNITFECITPCFCAGANQTQKEIRPASIRGALRWWFRCLGGTPAQEVGTFGGVEPVTSSAIQIRVSNVIEKPVGMMPDPKAMSPLAYILHFASIAGGDSASFGSGPRWKNKACYGQGTTFDIRFRQLRNVSEESMIILENSIKAFGHYGSIGMRVTRGLGAIQDINVSGSSFVEIDQMLEGYNIVIRRSDKTHRIWDAVLKEAGIWLKNDLRDEFGAGGNRKPAQASALGSIEPVRQTSAVHLRPIKLNDGLIFSAFEPPHDKVLGDASKRKHSEPVLKSRDFTRNPPIK